MTQEEIVKAISTGKPLGSIDLGSKEAALRNYIEKVYQMKGMEQKGDRLRIEVGTLEDKLSHAYAHLTLAEVQLALEAGVTGEFKDVSTVPNVANFLSWVAFYNRCADRADALKVARSRRDAEEMRNARFVADEMAARLNAQAFEDEPNKAYAKYLAEGREGFTLAQYLDKVVYEGLIRHGKMQKVTPETMEEARAAARKAMTKELPTSIKLGGVNAVTEQSYIRQELVFRYFETLKNAGRTKVW